VPNSRQGIAEPKARRRARASPRGGVWRMPNPNARREAQEPDTSGVGPRGDLLPRVSTQRTSQFKNGRPCPGAPSEGQPSGVAAGTPCPLTEIVAGARAATRPQRTPSDPPEASRLDRPRVHYQENRAKALHIPVDTSVGFW
jgi:hypothetical protein